MNGLEGEVHYSEQKPTDWLVNGETGIQRVGPDGVIQGANQAQLDLLGYDRGEYIGKNLAEFLVDRPAVCDILASLSEGAALRGYTARLRCKDGEIRHTAILLEPVREYGRLVCARCLMRPAVSAQPR